MTIMEFLFNFLILLYLFIIGACIGSFINMAIYRTNKNKNFFGTSFCDHCKKPLVIKDLIPLLSFIYYKGKSRCCNRNLDKSMPVVEVLTALSYLVLGLLFVNGFFNENVKWLILIFWLLNIPILIFVFFYDLKFFEIPVFPVVFSYFSWVIYKISLVYIEYTNYKLQITKSEISKYLVNAGLLDSKIQYLKEDLIWTVGFALFVFMFFLFLFLITKGKGMGFGDVYFSPLLALLCEYPSSPIYLSSSFIVGAVFGVILIIFKGKNMKTAVPFGPFLIIGLLIALTSNAILSKL